jgi:hypothetical protein
MPSGDRSTATACCEVGKCLSPGTFTCLSTQSRVWQGTQEQERSLPPRIPQPPRLTGFWIQPALRRQMLEAAPAPGAAWQTPTSPRRLELKSHQRAPPFRRLAAEPLLAVDANHRIASEGRSSSGMLQGSTTTRAHLDKCYCQIY